MNFEEFASIEILESQITITEKIHGSNAQVAIDDLDEKFFVGSRTRWITPEDDNYGFANRAYLNEAKLRHCLGPGRHYGEWYGQGIGPGYNLKEKRWALFNTHRWTKPKADGYLLPWIDVVPILYQGLYTPTIVQETMAKLKASGSVISPGYMKPEGVVIFFARTQSFFKQVFEKEDTAWDREVRKAKVQDPALEQTIRLFLQPIRLEKLILRDERLLHEYPKSLPEIVNSYLIDLVKESEPIPSQVLNALRTQVFKMVRDTYGK